MYAIFLHCFASIQEWQFESILSARLRIDGCERRRVSCRSIRSNDILMDSKVFNIDRFEVMQSSWIRIASLSQGLIESNYMESGRTDSKFIGSTRVGSSRSIRTFLLLGLPLFWFAPTSELRPISSWTLTNSLNFSILWLRRASALHNRIWLDLPFGARRWHHDLTKI